MENNERKEEVLELRKQILLAEEQRVNGEKAMSIQEAREALKNE